jgi:hypothetical protein
VDQRRKEGGPLLAEAVEAVEADMFAGSHSSLPAVVIVTAPGSRSLRVNGTSTETKYRFAWPVS